MSNQFKSTLVFAFLILFVAGCTSNTNKDEPGNEPIQSNTQVINTSLPAPTQIINPAISTIEIADFIQNLYSNNSECNFPCFWGITPGKDTIQNVYDHLSSYGVLDTVIDDKESNGYVSFSMAPPKNIDKYTRDEWRITLGVQNGIVEDIYASSEYISGFADPVLDIYLKRLGPPEEIGIMIFPGMGIQPWYEIVLFYPDKGILVSWRGITTPIIETNFKITTSICPQNFGNEIDMILFLPPYFLFWAPNENLTVPDIIEEYLNDQPYQMVSTDNSDIDPESFYKTYVDSETEECFQFTLEADPDKNPHPPLSKVLKENGKPAELWIALFENQIGDPLYELGLFYPEKDFLIHWSGTTRIITDTDQEITISVCPQNMGKEIDVIPDFQLWYTYWVPDEIPTFSEINNKYLNNQQYLLISGKNSDIDPDSFYKIFVDPENEKCFQYTLEKKD